MDTGSRVRKAFFRFWNSPAFLTALFCSVPLLLYLYFALPRLKYPGLNYDEVLIALPALRLLGHDIWLNRTSAFLDIGSFHFPLTVMPYNGAMDSYLVAPFIFLGGNIPEMLRAYGVFFGAATLVAFFFLAYGLFGGRGLACFAASLLAVHPTFVSGTRIGLFVGSTLLFFLVCALLSLLYWHRTKKTAYLCLAVFLLGCGMACRSWMIFSIGTLVALALLFRFRSIVTALKRRPAESFFRASLLAACFALGALPFTVHVVRTWGFGHGASWGGQISVDHSDYFGNLAKRFHQIGSLLGRDGYGRMQFDGLAHSPYRLHGPLFVFSFLWVLLSPSLPRRRRSWKKNALFALAPTLFWMLSPFTLSSFKLNHLFTVLPFCMLVVALAAREVLSSFRLRERRLLMLLIVLLGLFLDAPKTQSHLKSMRGVSPGFSDAVYDLHSWLEENDFSKVVDVSWGFGHNLAYLMADRDVVYSLYPLAWVQRHYPSMRERMDSKLKDMFSDPSVVYVAYYDESLDPPLVRGMFSERARLAGKEVVEVKRFIQRDGTPTIRVMKLR